MQIMLKIRNRVAYDQSIAKTVHIILCSNDLNLMQRRMLITLV